MLTIYSSVSRIFFNVFDPSKIWQWTLPSPKYSNAKAAAFFTPSMLLVVVMHSYWMPFSIPTLVRSKVIARLSL